MKGIRGAITVGKNSRQQIIDSAQILLKEIFQANNVSQKEIVSIIFTCTVDLDRAYPAVGARQMGLDYIPLMCYQEMKVQESLARCLRIMVYIERDCSHRDIEHVYLRKAKKLRPDLVE